MADDIIEIFEIGLTLRLVENGIDETKATGIVADYFEEARETYGGVRVMLKRGYQRYPPSVIRKIRNEFNGRNGDALRRRYGMSRTHFYRTIRK